MIGFSGRKKANQEKGLVGGMVRHKSKDFPNLVSINLTRENDELKQTETKVHYHEISEYRLNDSIYFRREI